MRIGHFDDLLRVALEQDGPQRLLVVLLRAETDADGPGERADGVLTGTGTLTPVMATDLELGPDMRLDALVEEADGLGHPWDLLLVSVLGGTNGRAPTGEDAEPYLREMADAVVQGGDLTRYAVFDRAGCPVRLSRGAAPGE